MNKFVSFIRFDKVFTLEEVEIVRRLRNQNREFMTNDTSMISAYQQKAWWENLDHDNNSLYLLVSSLHGVIMIKCGYGYVRFNKDHALLSAAIEESFWGYGFGEKMFRFLIDKSYERVDDVRLEVLKDNHKALSLYKKLGFKKIDEDDRVIKMKL